MFDWTFMHSHSAYLETLLNVGVVGIVLGLSVVFGTLVISAIAFRRTRDQSFHFVTALLVFALVHGFLDGGFARDGFETFVALLAITTVVFHGAPSLAKVCSEPRAKTGESRGLSALGAARPSALRHTQSTVLSN